MIVQTGQTSDSAISMLVSRGVLKIKKLTIFVWSRFTSWIGFSASFELLQIAFSPLPPIYAIFPDSPGTPVSMRLLSPALVIWVADEWDSSWNSVV